jgi:NAD(P)H-dependent FMN reductase
VLIQVISSTTREGRFSERTAHWVVASLRAREDILPDVMLPARQAGDVSDTTAFAPLEPKLKMLADDLTWWAAALAAARARDQR